MRFVSPKMWGYQGKWILVLVFAFVSAIKIISIHPQISKSATTAF